MKKKAGILTAAFMMLLCMFCVWPFALVRKDTKCETRSTAYLFTNQEQLYNTQMDQTFIAQESQSDRFSWRQEIVTDIAM